MALLVEKVYSNILFGLLFINFLIIYFVLLYTAITHNFQIFKKIDKTIILFVILFYTLCIQLFYKDIILYKVRKLKLIYLLLILFALLITFYVLIFKFVNFDKENSYIYIAIAVMCLLTIPFIYLLFVLLFLTLSYIDLYTVKK
jgi:hypothetical protein